jgi:xylulokinase
VYWSHKASALLSSISPNEPLVKQLDGAFSRQTIPNWQDSSTTSQCRSIEQSLGGPEAVARLTGSKAHERFTGPQIMRFIQLDPEAYTSTSRISLVSSFITTLLCLDGDIKGIDESDACGMNLWSMENGRGWSEEVLKVVVGDNKEGVEGLKKRLGEVEVDGGRVVGRVGQWFVERYGFNEECSVFPGTGDNPATFLSLTCEYISRSGLIRSATIRGSHFPRNFRCSSSVDKVLQSLSRVSRFLPPSSNRPPGQIRHSQWLQQQV